MRDEKKVLVVKNLSYTYPDGNEALKNISFEIFKGENIALVGPNGAGKSTLLLHLNRIIENHNSSIEILGMELNKKNVRTIRKKVGFIFQDPDDQLFMSTVFDDIAFGPINMGLSVEQVHKRVTSALKMVGLEGFEDRCPQHLSFGEKKIVSIATVLSMHPEILLLDEPTANLDPMVRRQIIDLMRTLPGTKIIASHDIEMLLEISDRAILLDHGKTVAIDKAEKTLTNMNLLKQHGLDVPIVVKLFGNDAVKIIRDKLYKIGVFSLDKIEIVAVN